MYLVDTNVWLERLLDQKESAAVKNFLNKIFSELLFITDFSFHSISLIMIKLGQRKDLLCFIQDVFIDGEVNLVHLLPEDTKQIIQVIGKFNLDFICIC